MSEQKEKRTKSEGKCQLCNETFSKQAMSRHLKSCIEKSASAKSPSGRKAKAADTFLISVEGRYLPQYWMHLEARADATLGDIDGLLRYVWLECCGHLSSFNVAGKRYDSTPDDLGGFFDDEDEAGGMDEKLSRAISPGIR